MSDELDVELALQSADLPGERLLARAHACGGPGEVELVEYTDEVAELAGLDANEGVCIGAVPAGQAGSWA
jgi:hypothetical protein